MRVPWTARRSYQSILKEISPGISLEGMMLQLKLQYFGHLMRKADLKLNIPKTKIMEYSPITINSWQIDEETMETVTDFIFLGPKITADGDCSHEIKRCLFLGIKAMIKTSH